MKIKIQGKREPAKLANNVIDALIMISDFYPKIDSYSDIELHMTPLDSNGEQVRLVNEYGEEATTYVLKDSCRHEPEQVADTVIATLKMLFVLYPEIDSYSDIELHMTPLDGKGKPRRLVNEYGKEVKTYILKDPNSPKRTRKRKTQQTNST